ncbi:HAD-IIIC family phosphatase [Niastella sp. OAS944]|uniref:HAD-IIIC family phosphatase n=1 Tax=Niastella sp. OAS944 TaxID=2664089 RepID=UPI003499819C|nr:FkbH-like protein [Chitinophagaceae bacterium OAS944]
MKKTVKCLVWDLDNTLWDGTLLESPEVKLKQGIPELLRKLDEKGIINSIASKNNYQDAMEVLKKNNISEYFLYPEIHWNAKSVSIANIQKNLNIGIDTIAFIDDQDFERHEVSSVHTDVYCLDAKEYAELHTYERFNPGVITEDARRRRHLYQEDLRRSQDEKEFQGPKEEFLAGLNIELLITPATEADLTRMEELTIRTNQLSATGKTYKSEELHAYMNCDSHRLMVWELKDKYGSYGKIGLVLLKLLPNRIHIEMILCSCRVMSRGIGTVMLQYLAALACKKNKKLTANYRDTGKNRIMYLAYKFASFKESGIYEDDCMVMEYTMNEQFVPAYIKIIDHVK